MVKKIALIFALALFAVAAAPAIDNSVLADPPDGKMRKCPPC